MQKNETITGQVSNFSFGGKKPVRGWYLILTDDGEEYLVKRNFGLSSNWYRKVYQVTNFSFKKLLIEKSGATSGIAWLGIPLGSIIASSLRTIIPMTFIFGPTNQPISIIRGLVNIITMFLVVGLSFFILDFFRKRRLLSHIEKQGGQLIHIGKVKSRSYLTRLNNGRKCW